MPCSPAKYRQNSSHAGWYPEPWERSPAIIIRSGSAASMCFMFSRMAVSWLSG